MKKVVAVPAGKWARELLTLSGAERISYFLDDDAETQKSGFPVGNSLKPVYPINHVAEEDPDEMIIVVTDARQYADIKNRLMSFGLKENRHVFDGWHLDISFYRAIGDGYTTWTQYENSVGGFDYSEFSVRSQKMASLIPQDVTSVMDMGCGDEVLRQFLSPDIKYYGLDVVRRNADTIVCDANAERIPDIQVDVYYMAGFLLYMNDVKKLISQMRRARYLIFDLWNYVEFRRYDNIYMNIYTRRARSVGWNERDHFLSLPEIIDALTENGFFIEKALDLNRNGSYSCYLARNLNIGQ